jgi:hypothetical protein
MKTLIDIMVEKNLRNDTNYEFGTDKEFNHRYCTAFYDKEFEKYRDKEIRLLEIGIHRGGSLALWHEYFPKAYIIGVDSLDFGAKYNTRNYDRVKVVYADGYRLDFAETLPTFDIIIDDGPHTKESHLQSLQVYLSKLKEGGVFVIEDISHMEWTEEYKALVPAWMSFEVIDARELAGMSDSIMFIVRH